ncbi:GPR1/FUN34/yaaH family-domain-containing protein [Dissophora ornata]|nr:hypothetical protein BGZ58_009365 [Dissophora ornata]KAI8603992.1 GPR1/FUN34/yaaH family-domain-containing protein [Dissophora ornata]
MSNSKDIAEVEGSSHHQMVDIPPSQLQHHQELSGRYKRAAERNARLSNYQHQEQMEQQHDLPFRSYIESENIHIPPYQMDLNMEPEHCKIRSTTSSIKATPFGLFAFSLTAFCMGLYNIRAVNNVPANFMTGTALFMGGTGQVIAGLLEFSHGNTFGATAFLAYGLYWLSYSTFLIPTFGVAEAYANYPEEFETALGTYYLAWTIFTFLMWTLTWRSNLGSTLVFFFLGLAYLFASISSLGHLAQGGAVQKLSGATGLVASACACYSAMADLSNTDNSFYTLPMGQLGRR